MIYICRLKQELLGLLAARRVRCINANLGVEPSRMHMRPTNRSEVLPRSSPDGMARLEKISHAQPQSDVQVEKWPKAARMAFLLVAALGSWAAIIGLIVVLF